MQFGEPSSWKHAEVGVDGGVAESLKTDGLDESETCVGAVHQICSVTMSASQPRHPCLKLTANSDDPKVARAMVKHGRAQPLRAPFMSRDLRSSSRA